MFMTLDLEVFQIWTAFKLFDKNGDGMVTKAEFRKVFQNQIASYRVGKNCHISKLNCVISRVRNVTFQNQIYH